MPHTTSIDPSLRPLRTTRILRPAAPGRAWLGFALLVLGAGCSPRPSSVVNVTLPLDPLLESASPYITCGPQKSDVFLCWLAGNETGWRVWFSRSADAGATWTPPVAVSDPNEAPVLDPESSPRLACDEVGRVAILWTAWLREEGRRSRFTSLRLVRSVDGGHSWSTAATLEESPSVPDTVSATPPAGPPASQASQDLYLSRTGELVAAWLEDGRGADGLEPDGNEDEDSAVRLMRSKDFGVHWGPEVSQWSRACRGSRVRVIMDPGGFIYALFRKRYGADVRDVVVAEPGRAPRRVQVDDWSVESSPAAGPAMVLSHDGTVRVAWFTGAPGRIGLWFRQSMPDYLDSTVAALPLLTGDSVMISHASLGDVGMSGTLVAVDADSAGDRRLTLVRVAPSGKRVIERFVVPGTEGAFYPRVAADHTRQMAYVAWMTTGQGRRRVKVCRWNVGR